MPEERLEFADHDQVRTLFGDRDRHLRLIRDELGVDVVLRDGVIRIFGDQDQVKRGREVFEKLAAVLRRTRNVRETDVWEALGTRPDRAAAAVAEPAAPPPSTNRTADPTTTEGYGERIVDLFERGRRVRPKTAGQDAYLAAIEANDLVLCVGPAGCGKTYLAVAAAINALRREQVRKIVLVRPAVEAGEKLGFLPGDMFAKVNPYLRPLLDALNDMLDFEQVQRYMSRDMIEIVPLAFMRGRTLNDTFIILDEGQNTTVTQMKMFLTRMGAGSRIVVTGDVTQLDLPDNVSSGLTDAAERLAGIDGVAVAKLGRADIVRHRLVREIVHAYDRDASASPSASGSSTKRTSR
ncbi:MAG: PhoH family protein [Planctomycetota bacterium]|nr:PhoH family protein [Planctomycetaceae bacterium]MDQ3331532.1 PhoH family protein [Planctomycetota bacterium]